MSYEKFLEFLSERFGIDIETLETTDSFRELGVDSLSLFNIISDLEEDFDIRIEIEDMTEVDSVKKMFEYISSRLTKMKIPELVLDYECAQDEDYIFGEICAYDFIDRNVYKEQGFEVCRIGGYQYKATDDGGCSMIGWQCNFAAIQNYDIQLPTIILIKVDASNTITSIRLSDKFKGSQGIPCSFKYLNRRLQEFV